MYDPDRCLCHC
ncbi:hypothetical protein EFR21_02715 [Lactobacillus delbrueckii subsp. bulgaricus]|nr:MAG: hypothetical protein DF199_05965 [Lactobacillus delbrueckii subsp. lactis]MCT3466053.1 hypothetical protein [Lactobacillus delbrueckii subsp. bulgaricus]MCT3576499.1 hypothetical protein [Lactobacillus delbrueckii]MCT3468754.1 hypothetical protein [Lactobacillus delbrueckii subsp. bulgaricus]MCT3471706.1 hypothetical protein [Lactobacillus delbrueckii subsp. bulgaricus]